MRFHPIDRLATRLDANTRAWAEWVVAVVVAVGGAEEVRVVDHLHRTLSMHAKPTAAGSGDAVPQTAPVEGNSVSAPRLAGKNTVNPNEQGQTTVSPGGILRHESQYNRCLSSG